MFRIIVERKKQNKRELATRLEQQGIDDDIENLKCRFIALVI